MNSSSNWPVFEEEVGITDWNLRFISEGKFWQGQQNNYYHLTSD